MIQQVGFIIMMKPGPAAPGRGQMATGKSVALLHTKQNWTAPSSRRIHWPGTLLHWQQVSLLLASPDPRRHLAGPDRDHLIRELAPLAASFAIGSTLARS